jgi:saccharopine dehydrogenase-like NADP-dependent oxidoreductase
MTSAKMIREIRQEGGIVTSYASLCGALVAPENSDGPMGYKFSWSPRGVLTAATRPCRFLLHGEWYEVDGKYLYHLIQPLVGFAGLDMFWVPNGNAEKYAKCYELTGPEVETVLRGTLRYHHYAPVVTSFHSLGLLRADFVMEELKEESKSSLTWPQVLRRIVGGGNDLRIDLGNFIGRELQRSRNEVEQIRGFQALKSLTLSSNASAYVQLPLDREVGIIVKNFERIGLLNEQQRVPKTRNGAVIDSLCTTLTENLTFRSHERDFVMMLHRIKAYFPSTGKKKIYKATLAMRGRDLVNTATALTVGLPVGAAAQLILDQGLSSKAGILIPTDPEIYNPVLKVLAAHGITMHEEVYEE